MKGDFTRDTFDPAQHFSRVLMQQGRVTLDADYNEQTAILLHYLRTLARDLIGPFGVPGSGAGGFALSAGENGKDIDISHGRCYVDGILVENDEEAASYLQQPCPPADPADFSGFLTAGKGTDETFLLYLDVWERHLTWIENERIRDIALGGPDTCTRAEVVWQVKARVSALKTLPTDGEAIHSACLKALEELAGAEKARRKSAVMTARLQPAQKVKSACILAPESRYRGLENQLYRVEVHDASNPAKKNFTFKWSRDNGSTASALLGFTGNDLEVASSRGFAPGIWVEISIDSHDAQGRPGWMVKLTKVEGNVLTVDPQTIPAEVPKTWKDEFARSHPKVRRWDQAANESLPLVGGVIEVQVDQQGNEAQWFDLEDGIQVAFLPSGAYRSGDYWLIPARVASGQIEWPMAMEETGEMVSHGLPPRGIEHHYAPLGFVALNGGNLQLAQCICTLTPIGECVGLYVENLDKAIVSPKKTPKKTPGG